MRRRAFLIGVACCASPFGGQRRLISSVTRTATTMAEVRALHGAISAGIGCGFCGALLLLGGGGALILAGHALIGGALAVAPLLTIHGLHHYFWRHI